MIGKTTYLLLDPSQHENMDKSINKIKKREKIVHYEAKRQRKDGRKIYLFVNLSPIKNENGEITGISVISRDITERKKTVKELK